MTMPGINNHVPVRVHLRVHVCFLVGVQVLSIPMSLTVTVLMSTFIFRMEDKQGGSTRSESS
jgi:hypothetical protein